MVNFNFPIFTQLATYLALSLNSQEDLITWEMRNYLVFS